jgi:hypothetical protein
MTMAKMTEWKKERLRKEFKELAHSLIPLIDEVMTRNQGVSSWEYLSEDDQNIIISQIHGAYLENYNFRKAIRDGFFDVDHAAKILAFIEWEESLGGWED